jgi:hypothetical protein
MKVITNTPEELVLESRPILGGILLSLAALAIAYVGMKVIGNGHLVAGLLILAIGLGLCAGGFWGFIRYVAVRFSRPEGKVQIRVRSISGATSEDFTLADVIAAVIESSMMTTTTKSKSGRRSTTRKTRTYRAALAFRDARATRRPLVEHYTSDEAGVRALVDTINRWIGPQGA